MHGIYILLYNYIAFYSGGILFEVFTGQSLISKYKDEHEKEHRNYNKDIFTSDMKKVYNEASSFESYVHESLVNARLEEADRDKEDLIDLITQLLRVKRRDRIHWDSFVVHNYINPNVCTIMQTFLFECQIYIMENNSIASIHKIGNI